MKKNSTQNLFKKAIFFLMFSVSSFTVFSQQQVSYYFQAHADDWQLFMSSNAWDDVSGGAKVVFVTLTAGQASYGAGNTGGDEGTGLIPYYLAREQGSIASTIFMSHEFGYNDSLTSTTVKVNGHKIRKVVSGNVVNYYLRLSDGGGSGQGYPNERYASLQKLHDGIIKKMYAIDTSAVYNGWQDLVTTLQTIVTTERNGDPTVFANCADTNTSINPGDHPDHFYTSLAVQDAVDTLSWVGIAQYVDYYSQNLPPNLSTDQLENASALEASDILPVIYANYASTWEPDHKSWLPADYFRVTRFAIDPNTISKTNNSFAAQQASILNSPVLDNIYPNPVTKSQGINVNIHSRTAINGILSLFSAQGKAIVSIEEKIISGKSTLQIPVQQNIVPGIYYVQIKLANNLTDIKQVVIQ